MLVLPAQFRSETGEAYRIPTYTDTRTWRDGDWENEVIRVPDGRLYRVLGFGTGDLPLPELMKLELPLIEADGTTYLIEPSFFCNPPEHVKVTVLDAEPVSDTSDAIPQARRPLFKTFSYEGAEYGIPMGGKNPRWLAGDYAVRLPDGRIVAHIRSDGFTGFSELSFTDTSDSAHVVDAELIG